MNNIVISIAIANSMEYFANLIDEVAVLAKLADDSRCSEVRDMINQAHDLLESYAAEQRRVR